GNSLDFRVDITGIDGTSTSIKIDDARSLSDILGQINARTTETGITAFLTPNGKDISFTSEYGKSFSVDITTNLENKPIVTGTHPNDTFYVDDFDVTTVEKANRTLMAVDYSISQVTGFRAVLGAIQNRFESNVANLRVGAENMTASRSRIQDADFAAETAELTRNQILQQAGTSVLAQANQLPQTVLQLLQN
ncbi:flagellin, partial [Ectothiorhodospira lacustris]|uniref:flagellin n=1 Tax=Ectothiorhodospira lacustris TaxID=2899127 RepID=UPI0023787A8E